MSILLLAVLIAAPAVTSINAVESWCAVLVSENGESRVLPTPDLHVIEYNKDTQLVGFEADGNARVTSVLCERSSIIPSTYDYQVLLAGVPFIISAGDRMAALERHNGQYQLTLIKGSPFTAAELQAIEVRLKGFPLKSPTQELPNNSFKGKPLRGSP